MSQGSPTWNHKSMKEYKFLPEWEEDSDPEWEATQRQLSQPLEFTSTPLAATSIRNSPIAKEIKVHPYPHHNDKKSPHQQYQQHKQQQQQQQRTPNNAKTTPRQSLPHPESDMQQHYPPIPQQTLRYRDEDNARGNVHENEILMYREKLLQSVESVQCINDTLDSVCEYITSERTIDEKNLLRLMHPLKTHFGSYFSVNPALPSAAHILNQKFTTLEESVTNLLTSFVGCVGSRSKIYVSQIKRMREVSNTACRNALQAERAEFNGHIIHLQKQHMHATEEQAEAKRVLVEEKDKQIHLLTTKLTELEGQQTLYIEREQAMEQLRIDMQDRVAAAVATALRDARSISDSQRQELVDAYESKLQHQQAVASKREEETEFHFNEKMSVQTDHHEQLYALLSEEKDRLSQDLASLRSELQEQAHTFANEKAQYIEEFNTVQRESEIEGDVRVAEQIKVISTIKAEMAAKVRLMQEKDRIQAEEVNAQRLREKEEMETNIASEMDATTAQHRRALQHLRAQLEVKHVDELSRHKRNHENEVRRLVLETERMKKLVIRRGVGAGQDGVELEMEPSVQAMMGSTHRGSSDPGPFGIQETPVNSTLASSFNQYLAQQQQAPRSPLPTMTYDRPRETPATSRQPFPRQDVNKDNNNSGHHVFPTTAPLSPSQANKTLNWGALRESLTQQEEETGTSPQVIVSPIPKDNTNYQFQSMLETSPSGRLKFPGPNGIETTSARPLPPPPPPDTYLVDEAYEATREKGNSVSSNAVNIGKYMGQLQKYLEGDTGIEDTTFNTQSTEDESSSGLARNNTRYSEQLYESSHDEDSDEVDSLNGV